MEYMQKSIQIQGSAGRKATNFLWFLGDGHACGDHYGPARGDHYG